MDTIAEKRMFTQKIVESDPFLDLPHSAQVLYIHLNMAADDDGFLNNPKTIQRITGTTDADLQQLVDARFVLKFDKGVIAIKHWRMHNTLRKDRYKPTQYQEQFALLDVKDNGAYTEKDKNTPLVANWLPGGCQLVAKRLPQNRLDKIRLEESRRKGEKKPNDDHSGSPSPQINFEEIKKLYNEICVSFPKCTVLSDARKKAIRARINSGRTVADFETLFRKAEASDFLRGKNDRSWRASFDWLIKDGNMAKVLDGNYDNRTGGGKQGKYTRTETVPQWMQQGYASEKERLLAMFGESIEGNPELMAQAEAIKQKYAK